MAVERKPQALRSDLAWVEWTTNCDSKSKYMLAWLVTAQHGSHTVMPCCTTSRLLLMSSLSAQAAARVALSNKPVFMSAPKWQQHKCGLMTWSMHKKKLSLQYIMKYVQLNCLSVTARVVQINSLIWARAGNGIVVVLKSYMAFVLSSLACLRSNWSA